MKGVSRLPASERGAYRIGYAIIAAAMALALFATIPLVASSLPRAVDLAASAMGSAF